MLTSADFSGILTKGGTILGSSRTPFKTIEEPDENGVDKVEAMKHTYHKLNLDCLVVLGGNGTHKTANLLRKEGLNVVTLPKTIDNDLAGTDHTPGFGSAAKYVASSVKEVFRDSSVYADKSITIVEIMGRNAGWLTAAAQLANAKGLGADLIYLPEIPFDVNKFVADVKDVMAKNNNKCIAVVSEGIKNADGVLVCEALGQAGARDSFGHAQLGGVGAQLANLIKNETGFKTRGVELSLMQRCGAHLASKVDVEETFQAGKEAVKAN